MHAKCWAESVVLAQQEKVVSIVPAKSAFLLQQRRTQVPRAYYAAKESVRDPVLGVPKAAVKYGDSQIVTHQNKPSERVFNLARDKQLLNETAYDIVSLRPKVIEHTKSLKTRPSRSVCSSTPYNIVVPTEDVPKAQQSDAARAYREPRPLTSYDASRARRRGVDPITNMYTVDHESKAARDRQLAHDRAMVRYWQTHNLDPLTMTYVDRSKEEQYQQSVRASMAVQGQAKLARRPPSMVVALGENYDIVRHLPKDSDALQLVDTMDARPLRRFNRWDREEKQAEDGEDSAMRTIQRSLSRASLRRYEQTVDPHGFDIVTGRPREEAFLYTSAAGIAPTAWERIAGSLQSRELHHDGQTRSGSAPPGKRRQHALAD